jgi:hypothetical protein
MLAVGLVGCGSSSQTQDVSSGSSLTPAKATTAIAPAGTLAPAEFCKALIKLQHTPNSDPKVLAETLEQLRALQRSAPAEIRQDLQTQIDGGEELVRSGGTLNPQNPGSLMRDVSASSRRLNDWEAKHC